MPSTIESASWRNPAAFGSRVSYMSPANRRTTNWRAPENRYSSISATKEKEHKGSVHASRRRDLAKLEAVYSEKLKIKEGT